MSIGVWRPTAALARALVWLLAASALGQVLLIPFISGEDLVRLQPAFEALFDGRTETANRLFERANSDAGSSIPQLVSAIGLAMLVLLIVWTWRSASNARALGRTGARLAPAWGIFGWFVPVAWWFAPYVVVQDVWRSSDPSAARGSGWRQLPGAGLVRGWWLVFVGGQTITLLAILLAVTGRADAAQTESWLTVGHVLSGVGAILAIPVVTEITRRQAEQQAADPAPLVAQPRETPVLAATPGDPGWYPDPAGTFDERYWDGSAWTERVTSGGSPSVAPVNPAGWYRDPTARFEWRYWTGYGWTEHASRDGELFVDPPT